MRSRYLSGTALALAGALFVSANVISGVLFKNWRIDLTQQGLYTLSSGTKNILGSLEEPVRLRFYHSARLAAELPAIQSYGQRVRDMLEDFARRSNGRLILEIVDPEPFSDAEDRAAQAGLMPAPASDNLRSFYFGLVGTNTLGDQEVIPFFSPEREAFLEYDLAKFVHTLTAPKRADVAVMSALPLDFGPGGPLAAVRGQSEPYAVMQLLRQAYNVRTLDGTVKHIDPDVRLLILIQPRDLAPQALYAIDQFMMRGGRLIVLLDPWSETLAGLRNPATGAPMGNGKPDDGLVKLLADWGIDVTNLEFVADLKLAQRVQTGRQGASAVVNYLPWLAVGAQNLNESDLVTAPANALNLASAGAISLKENSGLDLTPLIQSSDEAMLVGTDKIQGPPDPEGLLRDFKPTGQRYTIAARISGPLKSAFPEGAPKETVPVNTGNPQTPAADQPHKGASDAPANILVIADADFVDDRFWVRREQMFGQTILTPFANNGDVLLNAADVYSGTTDLVSLRSRGRSLRPFERLDDMRRGAAQAFLQQEKALQDKLEETERQLDELQRRNRSGAALSLSAEEQQAIESFRAERMRIRRELRDVQRALNRDIESLQTNIKLLNIGFVPLVAAFVGVGFGWVRRRRARRI